MIMKKQIGQILLAFILINILNSCKTKNVDPMQHITNIDKPIKIRFGNNIIKDEEMALFMAEYIFSNRYKNIDFKKFKPFVIQSIEGNKVWEIIASKKLYGKKPTFTIRINKNTGEILNLWKDNI